VLIKAVIKDKPKMLTGLNQKVRGQAQGLRIPLSRMKHHRPIRHDLTPGAIEKVNEVTPLSPREGRRTARNADEAAEEG
jgi:hypothetical protein